MFVSLRFVGVAGRTIRRTEARVDMSMFCPSAGAKEEKLPDLKRRVFALAQTGCHDAFVAAAIGRLFFWSRETRP
ncbi:hypothetical protein [Mesorhizobium sp. Mes31]|uniref:hypothetical protein n=1 Tax=Mesorhizobium sp. Mes31 TaxID=2926017 RepID=UPI00211752AC|nr:hypothetical protein [Mesorhizobium sp. Mes31]